MIAKYTPAAIAWLPGDEQVAIPGLTRTVDGFYADCQGFQQKRGAAIVATFLLSQMTRQVIPPSGAVINSSTPICLLVEEFKMAAVASTMTNVTLDGESYNFQFGPEGSAKTLAQLEEERVELQSVAHAQKIARVNAYAKSNGGADMTSMVGIPVTIDFDANNPIQIGD